MARRFAPVRFFARDYWRLVAERPAALVAAAALLLGPAVLAAAWALADPGAAEGLVPAEYRSVVEPGPGGADLGLSVEEEADFAGAVFTNNILVALVALAGGLALGLVTGLVLVLNGILLGAVAGLAVDAGNGRVFVELVAAHGILELSCVVVAGAAGLRLGWSIIEPEGLRRIDSLSAEARRAVGIALGTAPWLVLAGLVEGFVTSAGSGVAAVVVTGLGLGALYWLLVVLLGRDRGRERGPAGEPAPAAAAAPRG